MAPFLLMGSALAQTAPQTPAPSTSEDAPPHKGRIVIQSHGEPPVAAASSPNTPGAQSERPLSEDAKADVSDAEREALIIVRYDLDARLDLQRSTLNMRAQITARNDGKGQLKQIPLQISSSLRWESATLVGQSGRTSLMLSQHRLDTDTDHTGAATEAVLPLPEPLAPGASAALDLFYSGSLGESGGRLARLGASAAQQHETDWDAVGPTWTGLRGFGNVLWYPVSSPQLFLAEGNTLFTGISHMRQREQAASMQLHLSAEYAGEPPVAAYFCGRRAGFKATADDPDQPVASGAGIATAEFPAQPLGFRLPDLFVIAQQS